MLNKKQIIELKGLLYSNKKISIISHYNPDGDAIGSSLALYQLLLKMGHNVKVIVPNQFPKFLKWMPNSDKISIAEYNLEYNDNWIQTSELVFCLDFNKPSRIDSLGNSLATTKAKTILIDHHQEPDTFDYMYSDTSQPATCQMIYKFIEALELLELLDKDIASCLYTGIITDTGNFRYRNTTSETHIIAGKLMDFNISIEEINNLIFDSNSVGRMKLLGLVLSRIKVFEHIKTSILYITKEEMKFNGFQKGDSEGFVNYGLGIKNTEIAIFISEDMHKNFYKLSFRSKGDLDMNNIARNHFNGGGHINASGGRSDLTLEETINKIIITLEEEKQITQNL